MIRAALLVAVLGALSLLAGCTTSQERSAQLASKAKAVAEAKRFRVGKTNRDLVRSQITLLRGQDANTVVVKVTNRTKQPQVLVPIGVDLYDAKGASLFTNRVDGLDAALNNIPVAEPGTTWWVNNQLPAGKVARTRGADWNVAHGGATRAAAAARQRREAQRRRGRGRGPRQGREPVAGAPAAPDDLRRCPARRPPRGGRSIRDRKLNPKGGKRQRFAVYFTGDPSGAQLVFSAPPSTLGGASQ